VGVASIALSEYSDEARCLEIYSVFPQIIRSQKFHTMKHYGYCAANHNELRDYGVDVSEVEYFTYSTFPNESDSFSIRADARAWAAGGWVLYNHMGDPPWSSDGALIKSNWLPES
jgi:hypothetical protein